MEQGDPTKLTRGLESIIDAAASILAEGSLEATFDEMARALETIVPFTSLAVCSTQEGGGARETTVPSAARPAYSPGEGAAGLRPVSAAGRCATEPLPGRPPLEGSI